VQDLHLNRLASILYVFMHVFCNKFTLFSPEMRFISSLPVKCSFNDRMLLIVAFSCSLR
jgi:hypothetical protein